MNENLFRFLFECTDSLTKAGVSVNLAIQEDFASANGSRYLGFFDEDEKKLEVALMHKDWLFTFAHEYCHFVQSQLGLFVDDLTLEAYEKVEDWMYKRIELSDSEIIAYIRACQACELDCEQRTVALLEKYNLAFDKARYIKLSNRYVLSYEASRLLRQDVRFSDEALKLLPDTFIQSLTEIPSGMLSYVELKSAKPLGDQSSGFTWRPVSVLP